jgi:predicted nucleotide-binding protein
MEERTKYINQLDDFKRLLQIWEFGNPTQETRTEINKKLQHVKEIVFSAGTLKTYSITPPAYIGGNTISHVDTFACIFNPPYGQSIIPQLIDMIDEAIGVIESRVEFTLKSKNHTTKIIEKNISNRIFLVHGRDNELKETTARFLEKLGLNPIILHEQPNNGKTIIEKFEAYSDVSFAIILMTPDDIGGIAEDENKLSRRARQNVVFELGYFIGKLGRKNVVALLKGDVEIPSDYHGVIYIEIDKNEGWKMKLSKEIKATGINIDLIKIFE